MKLFSLIIVLALSSQIALAKNLPTWFTPSYQAFIELEHSNSFVAKDSEVADKYRPQNLNFFKLPYILMPKKRLVTEVASLSTPQINQHFYQAAKGEIYIRFFIHPESRELYAPLIQEFGIAGYYDAIATSSTRTVLAADPTQPDAKPVFIKLSLAKKQDSLGRIVPAWEIRRSVRNTEQLLSSGEIAQATDTTAELSIIPEFAGAHIRQSEGLGYYVDEDQQNVFEHGFLLRDASFIEAFSDTTLIPMLSLYSGIEQPEMIKFWKQVRRNNPSLTFEDFFTQKIIKPFVRINLELMIRHGAFPQFHSQNVLLRIDPVNLKIHSVIHRDIGSFKTDYRLRWIHGLGTEQYRSKLVDKDFGLSWAAEKLWPYFNGYFLKYNFRAYRKAFRNVLPLLDYDLLEKNLSVELIQSLSEILDLSTNTNDSNIMLQMWMDNNPPRSLKLMDIDPERIYRWISGRRANNQEVFLPAQWQKHFESKFTKGPYLATNYGVLRKQTLHGETQISILFYEHKKPKVLIKTCKSFLEKKAS